jgi:hypothetical protein
LTRILPRTTSPPCWAINSDCSRPQDRDVNLE